MHDDLVNHIPGWKKLMHTDVLSLLLTMRNPNRSPRRRAYSWSAPQVADRRWGGGSGTLQILALALSRPLGACRR